jgi:hypothetical protein
MYHGTQGEEHLEEILSRLRFKIVTTRLSVSSEPARISRPCGRGSRAASCNTLAPALCQVAQEHVPLRLSALGRLMDG